MSDLGAGVCGVLSVGTGAAANAFVQVAGQPEIYLLQNDQARHIGSMAKLVELAGSSSPRVLTVTDGTLALYPKGAAILDVAPGALVRAAGDDRVYLPVDGGRLLYVPSFGVVADLGLSASLTVVSASSLGSWSQVGTLSPAVSCGGKTYFGASGKLVPLSAEAGLTVSDLGATVCQKTVREDGTSSRTFVRADGQEEIYLLQDGRARHVTSMGRLIEIARTPTPSVLTVTSGTLATIPAGAAVN